MNFFVANWEIVLGLLGVISTPLAWVFGGKQAKKVEIKKASADAVATMQGVYDRFLTDYQNRMTEVMAELSVVKNSNIDLQRQFNEIQLQYAKEVEKSQNWEKLHRELMHKYVILEKDYDKLKKDHDKLKVDFDKFKKVNK
jgi:predicted RNase H-like nuclease (RuvC/YqgF family)